MKKLCLISCLSAFLLITLTGCGQTGSLYLPDDNKAPINTKSSTTS